MAFSEKNIPTRNDMFQAMPMSNGFIMSPSVAQTPAIEEKADISVDEDGNNIGDNYYNVTRDYSVLGIGIQSANIQAEQDEKKEQVKSSNEEKKKQGQLRDRVNDSLQGIKDFQASYQDGLYSISINGQNYEFTDEDLDDAIKSAKDDPDAFAEKHGLTAEQAEQSMNLMLLLDNASPQERVKIIMKHGKEHPDATKAVVSEARDVHSKRDRLNDHSLKNETKVSETNKDSDLSSEQVVEEQKMDTDMFAEFGLEDEGSLTLSHAETVDGVKSNKATTTASFKSASAGTVENAPALSQDQSMEIASVKLDQISIV